MSTDIDWQRELDASFGSGEDVPVGHYVAVGQRVVRRRRRVGVVAALAAAAVVAGVAWGVTPGRGPGATEAPIATDPDGTAVSDGAQPWGQDDLPARFDGTGLEIREGAVVHERVDNLFPGKASESVALDITYEGERWWMSIEWGDAGAGWSATSPDEGLHESFDDFVLAEMEGGGMISAPVVADDQWHGGLVQWAGGAPTPRNGVTVVREVADPVPTAVDSLGLVLEKDGETTWMLITLHAGGSAASWSKERDSGWSTYDQWLEDQVAMATEEPTPTLVRLSDDSTVTPAQAGVAVIDQQARPDLRRYGTEAKGAASAVALLTWEGQRWFVLAVEGTPDDAITTVAASKAPGVTTLDDFVAFMADRADEGGMR
jgi:hypothetical protein